MTRTGRCAKCGWMIYRALDDPSKELCGCTSGICGALFRDERKAARYAPLVYGALFLFVVFVVALLAFVFL